MFKSGVRAALLLLACSTPTFAQDWAVKMFDSTSFKFGAVARGSKVEHRFVITNLYEEEAHISGIRSSCGCTTPEIDKKTLKTFETAELTAIFNTKSFLGQRNATLTVTFDKPYFAEVQLQVSGYVRTDVVLDPPGADFGTIDAGQAAERTIQISYAGRPDWQILEVKSPHPYIETLLEEKSRANGQVNYQLQVKLSPSAPVGYLHDQIVLVTNDERTTQFPVDLSARVASEFTVSPANLFMGVLHPGESVTKKVVVRGKKPFRITKISCNDAGFEITPDEQAQPVHLVPVTFIAGDQPGTVLSKIRIETDLGVDLIPELGATAKITPMPAN